MFRIRRIYDDLAPANRRATEQVQAIVRAQFPLVREAVVAKLPEQLRNPLKYRFRSVLFVAEKAAGIVRGFALLMHDPKLRFCYLDFLSAAPARTGGGIGGALYERLREEAQALDCIGVFFECLPDDPALCRDPQVLAENVRRLRFYERYGARPLVGTAYETPVNPDDDCPPYLVLDPLGRKQPLPRTAARSIVRAILERKYADLCPPAYVNRIVASFAEDPVRMRPPRYTKEEEKPAIAVAVGVPRDRRVAMVVNDREAVHHVRERGYVESPVRIRSILRELDRTELFQKVDPRQQPDTRLLAVHDAGFVEYVKRVCSQMAETTSVYPYVFPVRNAARPPRELAVRAGYYCIDTFTPLNRNAYVAARRSVDCAVTAAEEIARGTHVAYALTRPPGHHAERKVFGGFCYFNSAAAAAQLLSRHGKVAILDVDYHHGNGQQDIFYQRDDVLTISIHGHPSFAYPYFSGFEEEQGEGVGQGFNLNIPLGETVDGERYRQALRRALKRVADASPTFLVVALGLDTARNDPTGTWTLSGADFEENGRLVGGLGLPTLVVQEGGYDSRVLGSNARRFFHGLWQTAFA